MTDPGPPPKGFRGLRNWLQRFYEFSVGNQVQRAPGTLIRRGPRGTSITGLGGDDGGPASTGMRWKGKWDSAKIYQPQDMVWAYTDIKGGVGLDTGYEVTLFVAKRNIPAGGVQPYPDVAGQTEEVITSVIGIDGSDLSADWDIVPTLYDTLSLRAPLGESGGSARILLDAVGYATGSTGTIFVIEAEPVVTESGDPDALSNPRTGQRIELNLARVPTPMYIQLLKFHNVTSGVDESRFFLCTDPQ